MNKNPWQNVIEELFIGIQKGWADEEQDQFSFRSGNTGPLYRSGFINRPTRIVTPVINLEPGVDLILGDKHE